MLPEGFLETVWWSFDEYSSSPTYTLDPSGPPAGSGHWPSQESVIYGETLTFNHYFHTLCWAKGFILNNFILSHINLTLGFTQKGHYKAANPLLSLENTFITNVNCT